jgi:predicted transcriptional regulator of viral defense system
MKFDKFVKTVKNLPIIDTELLLPGVSNPAGIKVQITRWLKAGKLVRLKRGVYLLAEPYIKVDILASHVASVLKNPSYISLEKALEFHGLIPEAVKVYTCVTTKRAARFVNSVGDFDYRHIQRSLFWGYESINNKKQTAFMATAEKALLDLFYLKHIRVTLDYLKGLRLQNVENINMKKLFEYAQRFKKPGMLKYAKTIEDYVEDYKDGEKVL